LRITTTRFGELELEDDKLITMPDGMVGFSERRFIILNPVNGGPFSWFQALENPFLTFVVVDPTPFFPGYRVKLTREEYAKLQLEPGDEIVLLCVATMSRDPRQITVNLQGPIVLNPACMIARQVVLEGEHTTRQPLFAARDHAFGGKITMATLVPRFSPLYSAAACC
jgi:flagellar assembly factor FliW